MVKAVIFDMGGVLIDLDLKLCIEAYKTRIGFARVEEFLDMCHHRGFVIDLEAGRISEQEFYDIARGYCAPGTTDAQIAACQCELLRGIPAAKADFLKKLASRYPLYILSNNNPVVMKRCKELFEEAGAPMDQLFRDLFLSYRMKLVKPCREIYEQAVQSIGLKPEEMLFIDDSMSNVEMASQLGIHAAFYERGTDLEALVEGELDKLS